MDRPAEMLNSTLNPEEVKRWRFNELMDYSSQKRQGYAPQPAAEIIAAYEPVMAEAQRLAAEYKAEFDAHPRCWVSYSKSESEEQMKRYHQLESRAYSQALHANKLRTSYSHLLAQSIWWAKVDAKEAARKAKQDAYVAALRDHMDEQKAFENAQVDAAIATLPPLPEDIVKRLRTLLMWAIHKAATYRKDGNYYMRPRDGSKRRVMRGLPPVEVGQLPAPSFPKTDYIIYHHAF